MCRPDPRHSAQKRNKGMRFEKNDSFSEQGLNGGRLFQSIRWKRRFASEGHSAALSSGKQVVDVTNPRDTDQQN